MERGINDAPFMAKSSTKDSFPLRIYTSTMPRAADTVSWDDFQVNQRSNLNPLDKGDFAGMDLEEIKRANPELYKKLEADPYNTRCVFVFRALLLCCKEIDSHAFVFQIH